LKKLVQNPFHSSLGDSPEPAALAIEIVSVEVAASFKAYFIDFWKRSRKFK